VRREADAVREFRGLSYLTWQTFVRQLCARKTVVALVLIALACIAAFWWRVERAPYSAKQLARQQKVPDVVRRFWPGRLVYTAILVTLNAPDPFGQAEREFHTNATLVFARGFVMPVYVGFLLPILSLLYAAAALGEEREERTLVYLLVRPLALWKVYLAKAVGIAPLVVATGVGGFAAICLAAGAAGAQAWEMFAPAIALACVAYSCLFLVFGALVPRPLVVGVGYALFAEFLVGNLPGTLKRLSIAYYTKCLIYEAGSPMGFQPNSRLQFLPVSGQTSEIVLTVAAAVLLAFGAWAFHRKEYRDLT
jgi:ABC-type transport system involved in multi-copper enzyme maturation permease subunit